TFPVLSSLAKDYLASSALSCSAERTFSSAADVCSSVKNYIDFSQKTSKK
ncbi:hypothetical protein VP01_1559g5, partial [Puccinia sorghi]